jgi:membrane-associated phospholipid phosphatase
MKKIKFKPIIMTIILIAFQSICYLISRSLQGEPYLIGNAIDKVIKFNIWFIIPYSIWYILIFLIPYILYKKNKDSFVKYIYSYTICTVIANIIFICFPTTVDRPLVESTNIITFITKIIFDIDTPIANCFPSLHCAVSMLFITYVLENKDFHIITKISTVCISLLIMAATLFVKQHVFVDFISGILLALISYYLVKFIYKKDDKLKKLLKL